MINVKDIIYKEISSIYDLTDSYPQSWNNFPAIQYTEEENHVYEYTDDKEASSYIRYRFDIWDNKSTSKTACDIDEKMAKLGFKRISCQDVPDSSSLKHKQMRYEAIIDCKKQFIYHAN